MKTIIIYFSRRDGNWVDGSVKDLPIGNTEKIASYLQTILNAPIFSLELKEPYSKDYDTCVLQAQKDQRENRERELVSLPDLTSYDTIYLGYPIYWEDLPSPIITLLKNENWSKKTIYPFSTHEGSGLGASISHIKELAKGATIKDPLPIPGSLVDRAYNRVKNWVEKHS